MVRPGVHLKLWGLSLATLSRSHFLASTIGHFEMGKARKPTALLELTGAYRKNPSRAFSRINEPLPKNPIGEPPEYFNDLLREIWAEIVSNSEPGVMMGSDRFALEAWCHVAALIRLGKASPAMFTVDKAYAKQFGMTPAARSTVYVPQDNNGNEFARAATEMEAHRARARGIA
jgi:hypothetical protein